MSLSLLLSMIFLIQMEDTKGQQVAKYLDFNNNKIICNMEELPSVTFR